MTTHDNKHSLQLSYQYTKRLRIYWEVPPRTTFKPYWLSYEAPDNLKIIHSLQKSIAIHVV